MPWGKHEHVRLPMGVCDSPDIFQEHMSELMAGLEFVRVYIDDLLIITKSNFKDHLEKLEQVFLRVQASKLKNQCRKVIFCQIRSGILRF